jgi:hypothetical protein
MWITYGGKDARLVRPTQRRVLVQQVDQWQLPRVGGVCTSGEEAKLLQGMMCRQWEVLHSDEVACGAIMVATAPI